MTQIQPHLLSICGINHYKVLVLLLYMTWYLLSGVWSCCYLDQLRLEKPTRICINPHGTCTTAPLVTGISVICFLVSTWILSTFYIGVCALEILIYSTWIVQVLLSKCYWSNISIWIDRTGMLIRFTSTLYMYIALQITMLFIFQKGRKYVWR